MKAPSNPGPGRHHVRAFRRFLVGAAVVTAGVAAVTGVVTFEGHQAPAVAPVSIAHSMYVADGGGFAQRRLEKRTGAFAVEERIVSAGHDIELGNRITDPSYLVSSYDEYVWTYGWQAQIDACQGAVDISAHYGVAVIAEHWRCGGANFPGAGSIVTLSGVRSGTYRVGPVVAVLNIATDGASDVPRGYGLLYQTCIGGSSARMSFTALTRVGG